MKVARISLNILLFVLKIAFAVIMAIASWLFLFFLACFRATR